MKKKLLLIDSSPISREMLRGTLEGDFEVIETEDGLQGLDVLDQNSSIACVVLVCPMVIGPNGLDILQTIRSDSRFKQLAVIVVGSEKIPDEVAAFTLGADDFIHIPCDPNLILVKIRNVLTNREMISAAQSRFGLQSSILDESDTAVYVVDAVNYNLYYVNHSAARLMGQKALNYTGKKCYRFLMEEKKPCDFCKVAIAHSPNNRSQMYIPKVDKTVKVTVHMMEWMGRPSYIVYENDITEEKKAFALAEKKYQQELQRRSMVNLDFIAYLLVNVTRGTVLEHDPHGFPVPTIASGQPLSDFVEYVLPTVIDFDKRREFAALISLENMRKSYSEGNTFLSIDYRRYSKNDNTIMWARSTIQLMKDPQSDELTAFLYTYDINEMRMTQEMIKAAVHYDYDILAHINLLTENFKCYAQNKPRLNRFIRQEYPYRGTILRYVDRHVVPEERDEALKKMSIETVREALQQDDIYEIMVKIKKGKTIRQKKFRYANYDKKYGMIFLSCVDVTNLLRNEAQQQEKLVEALDFKREESERKTKFLLSISEDMKASLNTIRGMAGIAAEESDNETLVKRSIESVKKATEYLTDITNDVLDLSRLESGKVKFQEEFCAINTGLEIVSKRMKPLFAIRNQSVTLEEQVYHKLFIADRTYINKMFSNLLRYMSSIIPSNGSIELRLFELPALKQKSVHYRLLLQGKPIDVTTEEIQNLLLPFYRKRGETESMPAVSGMELAIAKEIVSLYGGFLEVKKGQEDEVSFVVDLHFPMAEEMERKTNTAVYNAKKNLNLRNLRILVAEDKMLSILVARKLMESKGVRAEYTKSGDKAYQKFRKSAEGYYDLIVLELHLPDQSGYAVAQMIREAEHPQAKTIPIIAISDNLVEDNEGKCLAMGINAMIPKPIKADKLLKQIVSLIQCE